MIADSCTGSPPDTHLSNKAFFYFSLGLSKLWRHSVACKKKKMLVIEVPQFQLKWGINKYPADKGHILETKGSNLSKQQYWKQLKD